MCSMRFWFSVVTLSVALVGFQVRSSSLQAAGDPPVQFVRGDANADGAEDLSDAITVLFFLFGDGVQVPCLAAADANGDGAADVSDAIRLLGFIYLGWEAPPAPFPACGVDPNPTLPCVSFPACPQEEAFSIPGDPVDSDLSVVSAAAPDPGSGQAIPLSPEMELSLSLLAPGESVHSLKDVPGYKAFIAGFFGDALAAGGGVQDQARYTIRAQADRKGCLQFSPDVVELLGNALAVLPEPSGHLVAVQPPIVCGLEPQQTLLVFLLDDGTQEVRTGTVLLCDDTTVDCPKEPTVTEETTPQPPCVTELICKWVVTKSRNPAKATTTGEERTWNWKGTVTATADTYTGTTDEGYFASNGEGPWHRLYAHRSWANCATPKTAISEVASGEYLANLNVICLTKGGDKCPKAPDCTSTVSTMAFYESKVEVETDAGYCLTGESPIEALAMDESVFTVNGDQVFNKGVVVENGSAVTTTVSFELGGKVGVSEKEGAAGEVSTSVGFSRSVTQDTGKKSDALVCYGTKTVPTPTTLHLQAKGRIDLNANDKSVGHTDVDGQIWGVVYVGVSTCPGAGTVAGFDLFGYTDQHGPKIKQMSNFAEALTGENPGWVK